MIQLYLDTVDVKKIKRFSACLPVRGITTNPSILAKAGVGVNQALSETAGVLSDDVRFFVQVVSQSIQGMVDEAKNIDALPYDVVVKIPMTELGLNAIKLIKKQGIKVLATAIYSTQQGVVAALCGADYLAPYINRIDTMGGDGIKVVAELQSIITIQGLDCTLLPASFKNTQQVIEVMKQGVGTITLPVDVAEQMVSHPATEPAINQFEADWTKVFGSRLSFES
jgi:fructose-6-phosphate aldolase 1